MRTTCYRLVNESQAPADAANNKGAESAQDYSEHAKGYFTFHASPVPPDTISQF
jgi:hypothetical protein